MKTYTLPPWRYEDRKHIGSKTREDKHQYIHIINLAWRVVYLGERII